MNDNPKVTEGERPALLPCPFCGDVAVLIEDAPIWYVECGRCATLTGSFSFAANAVKSWNTRAPTADTLAPEANADKREGVVDWEAANNEYSSEASETESEK